MCSDLACAASDSEDSMPPASHHGHVHGTCRGSAPLIEAIMVVA